MTQEFVTLPREVVEQALEALEHAEKDSADFQRINTDQTGDAIAALRAALDQPKNHIEQHLGMVPAGWKLVPVEPTLGMIEAGKDAHYEAEKRIQEPGAWKQGGFAKRAVRAAHVFQAMLDAAPQPQALDQPQAEQPAMTPIAQRKLEDLMASGYTISGYSVYREQKHQHGFVTGAGLVGWWKPEGMEYPQPQGEQPLRYLDGGSRYKVTHLKTSGYCIIGLPEDLLGRWVALVDATDNKHMDSHQQSPTTEKSSVVQPQGEQKPRAWLHIDRLGGEQAFTNEPPPSLKAKCQPLYTYPQNINCKSTQARLATLWGYVKEQPKREPLTHYEIHELFRRSWDDRQDGDEIKAFARAIEAAHNIK